MKYKRIHTTDGILEDKYNGCNIEGKYNGRIIGG
jgi:hypothetical protein